MEIGTLANPKIQIGKLCKHDTKKNLSINQNQWFPLHARFSSFFEREKESLIPRWWKLSPGKDWKKRNLLRMKKRAKKKTETITTSTGRHSSLVETDQSDEWRRTKPPSHWSNPRRLPFYRDPVLITQDRECAR